MSIIERAQAAVVAELFRQGDLMEAGLGKIDMAQVDGSFRVAPLVRAVLTAMREPSDGMIEALWPGEPDYFAGKVVPLRRMTVEGWRAMIDAALAEG